MFISDYLGLGKKGHGNFDFVDVNLDNDNRLFIDPCLIEGAKDAWSVNATKHMSGYFDHLFEAMRKGWEHIDTLFDHAHEQNATKLGYGNGKNGKGKTPEGLKTCLGDLRVLVQGIPTISRAQDLPVLVRNFAEDCMSDLLTNILHEQLNCFTAGQLKQYGLEPDGKGLFWTWNKENGEWEQVLRPVWLYGDEEILLVPKWIVRRNYLFKAHQYLNGVIIERIQKANGWEDLKKVDIWNNLEHRSYNWEYDYVIDFTKDHPEALSEYHNRLRWYYTRAHGHMSDDELDVTVYGTLIPTSA